MRTFLLFALVSCMVAEAFAQDLVTKKNGFPVECRIVRVDSVNLYVRIKKSDTEEVSEVISRKDVKEYKYKYQKNNQDDSKNCFTVGFLQGGGSLVGVDIESLIYKHVGVQYGLGTLGFGGGINYHFEPSINTSFLSFQYWHQGIASKYTQSLVSLNYVYRYTKWFSAQLGLGTPLEKGPAWPSSKTQPKIMLTYAVGIYFPF